MKSNSVFFDQLCEWKLISYGYFDNITLGQFGQVVVR